MSIHLQSLLSKQSILLMALLAGCSGPKPSAQSVLAACTQMTQVLAEQNTSFLTRVQAIRGQHILLRDYDRQMIAALKERRSQIESTLLRGISADEAVGGCSGKSLDEMRVQARQEMSRLQAFLDTFQEAVRKDPENVYIDQQ